MFSINYRMSNENKCCISIYLKVSKIFLVLNFKGCNVTHLQLASVFLCLTDGYFQSIQTISKSKQLEITKPHVDHR